MTVKQLLQLMIAILCIAHLSACEVLMYPFIPLIIIGKGRGGSNDLTKCPTNLNGWSPLAIATIKGDLNQVKKLLPVDMTTPESRKKVNLEWDVLLNAARCDHKEIVELALTYKPDLYSSSGGGLPMLFYLAANAQPQLLELILQHGYDANFHYDNRWYPIFSTICFPARKQNITILLKNGASKDVVNEYRQTPLERAIQCQDKEAIRRLQQDPNQPEEEPKPFSGWLN